MSQTARDLLELRAEHPQSLELRRLALALIAAGVASQMSGC
jgi:hypothetical protein